MGTEIYHGYAPKPVVDALVKKYGMVMAEYSQEVVYKDDAFLAFTASSKMPIMLETSCERLTSAALASLLGEELSRVTDLKLPNTVTSISPDAFDEMPSLTALTFPYSTGIQVIEANTFKDCQNLKVLKLGNGVKTIEDGAFQNAASLEVLGLPFTLESVAETFIQGAAALASISFIQAEYQMVKVDVSEIGEETIEFDPTGVQTEILIDLMSKHLEDFEYEVNENKLMITYSQKKPVLLSASRRAMLRANAADDYGFFTIPTTLTVCANAVSNGTILVHTPGSGPYPKCTEKQEPNPITGSGNATYTHLTPDNGGINHDFDPDDPEAAAEYNKVMDAFDKFKADIEKQNETAKAKAQAEAQAKANADLAAKEKGQKPRGLPCPVCFKPLDDDGEFDYGDGEDDFTDQP